MNEYNSKFTGTEIDAAISRAAAGGSIDTDIALKAPLASPALTGTPTINGVPAANVGQLCNPNLLDDSYFVNPVDQRGGYVVPPGKQYYIWGQQTPSGTLTDYATVIGYKGPTSDDNNYYPVVSINEAEYVVYDPGNVNPAVRGYTGAGYGIDRWKFFEPGATLLIVDGGVRIIRPQSNVAWGTVLENYKRFAGKQVTLSFLFDQGLYSKSFMIPEVKPQGEFYPDYANAGTEIGHICVGILDGLDGIAVFFNSDGATVSEVMPLAAKLELGDHQTLAHQDENGVWVLNEIPDYGEQLARCQRYQLVIGQAGKYAPIGIGQARTSTIVSVIVPTPVSLRALPTVKFIAPVFLRNKDAFATIDYSNSRVDIYGPGTVMLNMACTSAIAGAAYEMFCAPGGKIILDANL